MSESTTEAPQDLAETKIAQTPADETVPASGTEQTSQEPAEKSEPEPKKTPWFQRRIDELTREKHDERRQREALEAQLRQQPRPQPTQQQAAPLPPGMISINEVHAVIARERAEANFTDACNSIADTGEAKYGDEFKEAINTFGMLGGPPPAFLEALTEFSKGEAAKLFYDLGKDPDEAARITKLSPAKMAVALAKMASAPVKAIPVSRTPAPIAPISSVSTRAGGEPDANDTKAWSSWYSKQMASR